VFGRYHQMTLTIRVYKIHTFMFVIVAIGALPVVTPVNHFGIFNHGCISPLLPALHLASSLFSHVTLGPLTVPAND
jgi:hypothetical protein